MLEMLNPSSTWAKPLADAGYRLKGLEVPVDTPEGRVVLDVLSFRADTNSILATEVKSGGVEIPQAQKYAALDARGVVEAGSLTLSKSAISPVQAMYAATHQNADSVLSGLSKAGVIFPVLVVTNSEIRHEGAKFVDDELEANFKVPVSISSPVPRLVYLDEVSPAVNFEAPLLAALVSRQARTEHFPDLVPIDVLASEVVPHLFVYAKASRKALVNKVAQAARVIADRDGDNYSFRSRTGTREFEALEILDSPETANVRGRTQRYQAIATRQKRIMKDSSSESQPSLFDFLDDLAVVLSEADDLSEGSENPFEADE